MTKKLDMTFFICVLLGGIGIVLMWVFDLNGHKDAAAGSLIVAGVFSFIAVCAKGLAALRRHNGALD